MRKRRATASSQTFDILNTRSAIFDDEGFASAEDVAVSAGGEGPSSTFLVCLLAVGLYFDSSVALWQNVYKTAQVSRDGPDCTAVHDWILANRHGFDGQKALYAAPGCPQHLVDELSSSKSSKSSKSSELKTIPKALLFRRLGNSLGEVEYYEKQDRSCSWKAVVDVPKGRLKCQPQSFTKGCALFLQAMCGLLLYYSYNYWVGGMELIKECFHPGRLIKFSAVGVLFGCGAVCSFLAQDALSPGSYALYAQSGIVIVPILWRLLFRKPMPVVTWIHIGVITVGIVAYRISEIDLDHMFDGVGLLWVTLKVFCAGFGSVVAELLLKQETALPFTVQVACILPSKALACLLTIWLIPGPDMEWPNHLPDRPGGFFHDWSFWTLVIVFHNLGDTILSAAVAKEFDSVVKAICGVVGIIFPTWVVSYLVGWEDLNPGTSAGQLKLTGGLVVVVGSFAYVFGRSQSDQLQRAQEEVEKLRRNRMSVELT